MQGEKRRYPFGSLRRLREALDCDDICRLRQGSSRSCHRESLYYKYSRAGQINVPSTGKNCQRFAKAAEPKT